jgi:hypothetical protein
LDPAPLKSQHRRRGVFMSPVMFLRLFPYGRFFSHRATAARRADSARASGVILAARAGPPFLPPFRPSATAAGFFRFLRGAGVAGRSPVSACTVR